jgi:hypothetical protein
MSESITNTPNYRLKVTAGPSYDTSTHQLVPVNEDQTLRIENEHAVVSLCVRIQDYTGIDFPETQTRAYYMMKRSIKLIRQSEKKRLPRQLPQNKSLLRSSPPPIRPILHLVRHCLQTPRQR